MSEKFFHLGDLVQVDYGYSTTSAGLFLRYYGPHDAGWESRAWVFVDGEDLPVPVEQITLLRRVDEKR